MQKYNKKLSINKLIVIIFTIIFVVSLFSTIAALAENAPFKLINISVIDKSDTVTSNVTGFDDDEASNDITFHKLYDSATYKLELKNNIDKEITILDISDDNENDYIDYQYSKHENEKINVGTVFNFIVKSTYKTELTDIDRRNQTNNVTFTITYLENEVVKEDTISLPTGDNINFNFILLLISGSGLVISILLDSKSKNKKISILIIATSLLIPMIVNAESYQYDVTLKSNIVINNKQIVNYTINGAENTIILDYGDTITGIDIPSKRGYTFVGWEYDNGAVFDATKPVTEDINIVAKYDINAYQITYNLDNGTTSTPNPTNYSVNDRVELVNPTKEHYEFIGWTGTGLDTPTKDVEFENEIGNRTYTANYEPINYSIEYQGLTSEEKTALNNPEEYNIETPSFTLNNPEDRVDSDGDKTYLFSGWKEGITTTSTVVLPNNNSIENKIFIAQWTKASDKVYTITYNLNGGTTSANNPVEFTKKTDTFTLNNPSKLGYTFKGWSGTDLTGTNNIEVKVYKGTRKNLEFEANYTPNKYQVIFNKNASAATGSMSNQSIDYDETKELSNNNYTRDGYTFNGWNTEPDGTGTHYDNKQSVKNLKTEGSITLYAEWITNEYTITFNGNNTSSYTLNGSMDNLSMEYDSPKVLPLNNYSILGYTFNSWNTKSDGTGQRIENGAEVNNLTTTGSIELFAIWDLDTYTISYELDDGTLENPITSYTVETNDFTLTEPTKDNFVFTGYTGSNGTTPETNVSVVKGTTGNLYYVANYREVAPEGKVARINTQYFDTLRGAITAAPTTGEETRIVVLANIAEEVSIKDGRNVVIEMQDYNWTNSASNSTKEVIANDSKLKIIGGSLSTNANSAFINNNANAELVIDGVKMRSVKKQCLYNKKGTVTIQGNSDLYTESTTRSTVHNLDGGTMSIKSGLITSASIGVKNERSTLNIGNKDEILDLTKPIIVGETTGLTTNSKINFYDGIIKGKDAAINDKSYINETELDTTLHEGVEDAYKILYNGEMYLITFDPNGGVVEETDRKVALGKGIGWLPSATKDGMYLEGWYTDSTGGERIDKDYVPAGDETIYAHWTETETFPTVFEQTGACTFNGSNENITGSQCTKYNDKKYIDTEVSLYSQENYLKDFELYFELDSYDPLAQENEEFVTMTSSKKEQGVGTIVHGFAFVKSNVKNYLTFKICLDGEKNIQIEKDYTEFHSLKIVRIDEIYYYSINNQELTYLGELTNFNNPFDTPVTFGAALNANQEPFRHIKATTISNMYIKLGKYNK